MHTTRARSPSRRLLWSIALTGCVAAAFSAWLALHTNDLPHPGLRAALWTWIVLSYIVAGLVAWSRRPGSRMGPLMVCAGFAAFMSAVLTGVDVPYMIGTPFRLLPVILFLHVFLAFPAGRLVQWPERVVVMIAYTFGFGVGVARIAQGDLGGKRLITVTTNPGQADPLLRFQLLAITGACLAGVVVLFTRRYRAGRPLRGSIDLLIDSFALGLVGIALLLAMSAFDAPGHEAMRAGVFLVVGLAPLAFLVGVLGARLARSAVGDLVLAMRLDPTPAALRSALVRALRDPSLTLAFWLPDYGTYADLDGQPVTLPFGDATRSTSLIAHNGAPVAALVHDPALNDEQELLDTVTAAAGIALENARLNAELRARLDELRGSRSRLLDAGQRERQRLERDLHDGAQQRLVALSLDLGLLEGELDGDPATCRRIDRARREVAASLEELRAVARGIHPAVVSGHGLEVALAQLTARATVPVTLSVDLPSRLPERLEVAAFYLVSESLANIGKHAAATSATVEISRTNAHMVVEIADDGIGGADTERGSGLRGLADRVEALDGRLRVWSPSGAGTRLRAEMPCVP